MKSIFVVDCETNPFKRGAKYQPYVWGCLELEFNNKTREFTNKEIYRTFETTLDFVEFARKKEGIFYAHNGGKFDWFFVGEYINEGEILYINGRLTKFNIGTAEFRDSFSILPVALKQFSKEDFDYDLLNDYEKNKVEIQKYLKSDCYNLAEPLKIFLSKYGTKNVTVAGCAFSDFVSIYGYRKNQIKTTSVDYDATFRRFYRGGLCLPFIIGTVKPESGTIKCYDINSAYPYAMMFEHAFEYEYSTVELDRLSAGCFENHSFVRFYYPGEIEFCNGEKNIYHLTGWELSAYIEIGIINPVLCEYITVYTHKKTASQSEYVNKYYAWKKNSTGHERVISKLFLNGLYGKFGSYPDEYERNGVFKTGLPLQFTDAQIVNGKEVFDVWSYVSTIGENKALYSTDLKDITYFNVAIAASITGFVRAYLVRHIKKAINPYYCDTDSIICDSLDCDKEADKLGAWKLEGEFTSGMFCGKKMYWLDSVKGGKDKSASKGVRLERGDFVKMVKGERVMFEAETPSFDMRGNSVSYISRSVGIPESKGFNGKRLKV